MNSTALFRPETAIAGAKLAQSEPFTIGMSVGPVSLRLTEDLSGLKGLWEHLQAITPCTSAQTYGWAQAWSEHVLGPEGRKAVIVVGYGADHAPLFLWPFEMETRLGLHVLKWLGQDHANYNMGLFTPEAARGLDASDMTSLLREAGRQVGAAVALFAAQPFAWDDLPNPFALLAHQPAPNSGYAIKLGAFTPLYESLFSRRSRGTLDRKERKLLEMGRLDYGWAETRDDRLALLDTFFAQKARQFSAMGVKDVFDAPARTFYRNVALLEADNPSRLRLGYVALDGKVLATFCGTVCQSRVGVMLSSLAEGDAQRQSPGALLLRHQIKAAADEGLAYFDLGVGQARHKNGATSPMPYSTVSSPSSHKASS